MIEYLPWDSDFFELHIGKVICHTTTSIQEIIECAKQAKYQLIYIFQDESIHNEITNKLPWIEHLIDKKLLFEKIIVPELIDLADEIAIYNEKYIETDLENLAIHSGQYSRFNRDTKFGTISFKKLYQTWIKNSVEKIIADEVFVYKLKDKIVGFITIKLFHEYGQIGLLASDPKYTGYGIGSALINAVEHYCITKNIYKLNVATQEDNTIACAFYLKNNFTKTSLTYIYHLWI